MDRIYHSYDKWECYQNGLYDSTKDNDLELIRKSKELLSNKDATFEAMSYVTESWVNSSEHFLSDLATNRRAWLGQAACCLEHGASEQATCKAWWQLSEEQRFIANAIANMVINEWESNIKGEGQCLKLDLE